MESSRGNIASDLFRSGVVDQKEYDNLNSLLNHRNLDFQKQGIQFLEMYTDDVPEWGSLLEDIVHELCSNLNNFDPEIIDIWNIKNNSDIRLEWTTQANTQSGKIYSNRQHPGFYVFGSDKNLVKIFCTGMIANGLKSARRTKSDSIYIGYIVMANRSMWPPEIRRTSAKQGEYWAKLKCI